MRGSRFKLSVEAPGHDAAFAKAAIPLTTFRIVDPDPEGCERMLVEELDRMRAKPETPEDHVRRFNNALSMFRHTSRTPMDIADALLAVGFLSPNLWAAVIETSPGQYVVFGFAS